MLGLLDSLAFALYEISGITFYLEWKSVVIEVPVYQDH